MLLLLLMMMMILIMLLMMITTMIVKFLQIPGCREPLRAAKPLLELPPGGPAHLSASWNNDTMITSVTVIMIIQFMMRLMRMMILTMAIIQEPCVTSNIKSHRRLQSFCLKGRRDLNFSGKFGEIDQKSANYKCFPTKKTKSNKTANKWYFHALIYDSF